MTSLPCWGCMVWSVDTSEKSCPTCCCCLASLPQDKSSLGASLVMRRCVVETSGIFSKRLECNAELTCVPFAG